MTSAPFKIANLVPPSFGEGYSVPESLVGPGFVSEIFELTQNIAFLNDMDRAVSGLFYVDASIRAEAAGYSAVFVNTFGDYGLRACRAAVKIPRVVDGRSCSNRRGIDCQLFALAICSTTSQGADDGQRPVQDPARRGPSSLN